MGYNINQEFPIRVVISFLKIKFNKGSSFFGSVVVFHTSLAIKMQSIIFLSLIKAY